MRGDRLWQPPKSLSVTLDRALTEAVLKLHHDRLIAEHERDIRRGGHEGHRLYGRGLELRSPNVVEALNLLADTRVRLNAYIDAAAREARADGVSFSEIGRALRVSRQAAFEKYRD